MAQPAVGILSTGSYLPKNEVSSEEVAGRVGVTAAWIERKTQIRYRRYVDHFVPHQANGVLLDVLVAVSRAGSADRGRALLARSLARKVRKGRLSDVQGKEIVGRIGFTTQLRDLADRQLVIESVPEDEAAKRAVFAALDGVVRDPDAILASNTSSIPVIKLGRATSRADRVVGMHFFNPVPDLPLVELTSSLLTDPLVTDRAEKFVVGTLGKQTIRSPTGPASWSTRCWCPI